MDFVTLLSTERIALHTEVTSTKRVFELLAELLAKDQPELTTEMIFEAFINREKLGCTALGNSIAIPHIALNKAHPCAALVYADEGLKMGAPDKKPVHLFLALLIPTFENSPNPYSALIMDLTLTLGRSNISQHIAECKTPDEVLMYLHSLLDRPLAA